MWFDVERRTGTYAKLVPCDNTKTRIAAVTGILNIENSISVRDLHVTVIYSRKECAEIKDLPVKLPLKAHGSEFAVLPNADGSKCLVVKLSSPELHDLHNEIKEKHGATHDWPAYLPHITLSYDYTREVPNDTLLEYFKDLHFDQYIVEPLDLNWISP